MDAIVPNGNSTLVTSDSESYGYKGLGCSGFLNLSDRVSTAAENIMNNDNSNSHHASSTAERIGLAGIDHTNQNGVEGRVTTNTNASEARLLVNQNGLEGRSTTNVNGVEGRVVTNQNGLEGRSVTERNAGEIRGSIERNGHEIRQSVHKEGHETREDVEKFGFHNASKIDFFGMKNFEATKDSLKDLLLQACGNTDRIICNDNSNAKEIVLQAANNTSAIQSKLCHIELNQAKDTAAIQLEAAKNFGAIQLEASKNKCAIELDAARHAADLAKQIAECCCEQKELTREKADETQRLILKLDEQRVRDQLRKTEGELEALKLRASLLPPLIPAVAV